MIPDRQELAARAAGFTNADFVAQHLWPALGRRGALGSYTANVVQNTGTGRLTIRYEFEDETVLHAKLYSDGLGPHCFGVSRALWENGFGANSRYSVPEVIAFFPEHNFLVMRAVPGVPLVTAFENPSVDLVAGSREAGRWLAALHRSSIRIGSVEQDWDSLKLFRVSVRLLKAAAAVPGQLAPMLELLHMLRQRIRNLPGRRAVVLTHGRYHHDHVFVGPTSTAVIDLDRCRPADPSKDVAEFVRVLRSHAFRLGYPLDRAREAARAFLSEYLGQVPETAATLSCYLSAYSLLSFLGALKKPAKGEDGTARLIDFYRREMEQAESAAVEMGI
jgi:aminoglycoside phosphotransferase (APT) family kinase protein